MDDREDIFLRNLAWKYLLNKHIDSLPVDIFGLADSCGYVNMTYKEYSELTGKPKEYIIQKYDDDGFVFWSKHYKAFVICYNEIVPPAIVRWTIMHEISHIELKHVTPISPPLTRIRKITHPLIEKEADGFARRVLCPSIVLHDCRATEVEAIMKLCGVSLEAAKWRSDYMKTLEARRMWRTDPREVEVEKQFLPFILRYLRNDFLVEFAMELMA